MFPRVAYLDWAFEHMGKFPFDLASSGMPQVPFHEFAPNVDVAKLDDPGAWSALRSSIAHYNAVPENEVIATLGTAQAIYLACATLAGPGDEIVLESPAYEPFLSMVRGIGAKLVRFERPAARGFAVDPELIASLVNDKTRLVVLSSLHNPSGVRTSEATLREVARIANGRGAHLLVGEVYAAFDTFANEAGVWPHSARHLAPNVITAASLTKCYGLGQHRFGWLLGPSDVITRVEGSVRATCGMLPLAHAELFRLALSHIDVLSSRARRLVAGKRARVEDWLRTEHPWLNWSAPSEGLFGFVTVPNTTVDVKAQVDRGAREHGVLVSPGAFFEMPNGFRLSWSIDDSRLDEALSRLSRVLSSLS